MKASKTVMGRRYGLALAGVACGLTMFGARPATVLAGAISDAAYPLLADRIAANRASFYVYQDADSAFNHGFPSGFFGDTTTIHLDAGCIDDPTSASGCSADANRLDRQRGTVLRISFDPQGPGKFSGVNFEEPENWAAHGHPASNGYNLSGATKVVFDIRSPTPDGVYVQFGVGGGVTDFKLIPQSAIYTTMKLPLSSFGPAPNLTAVHILFAVAVNDLSAPTGGTVLLDNIRFEPVPTSHQDALSFPLSTQTFGVRPRTADPFPQDQVQRNLTTAYESALTLLALRARGTATDLENVRLMADAFDYALKHENHGDPLPPAPDGSTGLHSGYAGGDIALFNGQGPGAGQAGDIRLAGFTCGAVSPTGFCVVLDGATGGNNAFAIMALGAAYRQFHDARYLNDAITIGNWIYGNLTDTTATGYGGYYLGYDDRGVPPPKPVQTGKSVENNADIFSAFTVLAQIDSAQADEWTRRANVAGDFVVQMFDPAGGRFYAGTVPAGTPPGPGINPSGPQRGNDVINVFDFLDSNTFTTLALAAAPRYHNQIDWRRPVQYVRDNFAQSVSAGGTQFAGFDIVKTPTSGPNGIAWEFTGQAVVAMRFVDRIYADTRFETRAAFYANHLRRAQTLAPFKDGRGLVASTVQNGDTLPPVSQSLNTPFQSIAERVGLAATIWAIFADQNSNLFLAPGIVPPSLFINDMHVTEGDSGTKNATFSLTLSQATAQTVTVKYNTTSNGAIYPATAGADYIAVPPTSVSFAPGQTRKTVSVTIMGDTRDEFNEGFLVKLAAPTNATLADGVGAGTIIDDDPLPTLSISNAPATSEGDSGAHNAAFIVKLSPASGRIVTVHFATANGTATAGSDYTAKTGTLTFLPGQTSKTLTVAVLGDTVVEPNETFKVNLTSPANATLADAQGVGTIQNDDSAG